MDKLSVGQRHQVDRLSEQVGQRLIDWSINETCQDVCAVITGPNGFYKKHRISLETRMAGVETAQATQHQTNPIAPRWTFRVRTH
jgi:hypothetical protein